MVSGVVLRVYLALLHEDTFIGKISIESWKRKLKWTKGKIGGEEMEVKYKAFSWGVLLKAKT